MNGPDVHIAWYPRRAWYWRLTIPFLFCYEMNISWWEEWTLMLSANLTDMIMIPFHVYATENLWFEINVRLKLKPACSVCRIVSHLIKSGHACIHFTTFQWNRRFNRTWINFRNSSESSFVRLFQAQPVCRRVRHNIQVCLQTNYFRDVHNTTLTSVGLVQLALLYSREFLW